MRSADRRALALLATFCAAQVLAAPPSRVREDAEDGLARRLYFDTRGQAAATASNAAAVEARELADRLIDEHRGRLFAGESLRLEHRRTRESLSGTQIFYRQMHRGIPVEGGEFAVALDRQRRPLAIWNEARIGLRLERVVAALSREDALQRVDRSPLENQRLEPRIELVVLPRDGGVLAYRVDVWLWSPYVDWRAYVDAQTGELLEKSNRMIVEKPMPPDFSVEPFDLPLTSDKTPIVGKVTGSGLVLPSNPLDGHPERYAMRDGDNVDPFRESKPLERLDGMGFLRGNYVDVFNVDTPPRAYKADHVFEYSAMVEDGEFEEVNAYWHIDVFQNYIKTVLGIDGANDESQTVTVHGQEGDNSTYSLLPSDVIDFGDGGVDDAQDGEVVLHEYGHAIHDAISGIGSGQNSALSEGFGDYCAATFSGNGLVAEWDATAYNPGPPPYLRRTDLDLVYPADYSSSPHSSGRIISGAWWDIRETLGAELADRLIIESFFLLSPAGDFEDFANATLQVDLSLYGGAHLNELAAAYGAHGIATAPLLSASHVEPGDVRNPDGPYALTLNVQGSVPLAGTDPVRIRHRFAGGVSWNLVAMSTAGGGDWTASLAGSGGVGELQYYFEVEDESANVLLRPAGAPTSYYSFSFGNSGIAHSPLADIEATAWPPTAQAQLTIPLPGGQLLLRHWTDTGTPSEVTMASVGGNQYEADFVGAVPGADETVYYELVARESGGAEYGEGPFSFQVQLPTRFALFQNVPNPFNPGTDISFVLSRAGSTRLVIYDVAGRVVRTLVDEPRSEGPYTESWNGRDDNDDVVASGVYIYRLETPAGSLSRRMTLLR